ncbi:hypothetical protein FRAHR75_230076 [Frankia sp. Hr75.2]|nr:hypothetical protein FRAHR75_230076 [Frankia sp. Hr75.2]SQD97163.1 hypothetical protein FMEAI12_3940081 [Parafrankia sp. Ea1.12]
MYRERYAPADRRRKRFFPLVLREEQGVVRPAGIRAAGPRLSPWRPRSTTGTHGYVRVGTA